MRINKYIADTHFAKGFAMDKQTAAVVRFLIGNRSAVAEPEVLSSIYNVRPTVNSVISSLFSKCLTTGYISEFAVLTNLTKQALSVPEALTMYSYTMDLKYARGTEPLDGFPELANKVLVNAANIVKVTPGAIVVSDYHQLHAMFVKALLSRNFSASDGWLNPHLCKFIIKSYGLIVAASVTRMNNLMSASDVSAIAMIYSLFMAQMLATDSSDPVPQSFFNQTHFSQFEMMRFVGDNEDIISTGLDVLKCCELVRRIGPASFSGFSDRMFYGFCQNIGPYTDQISTRLALEYPPYWVWLILYAVSGAKSSGVIMDRLKSQNLRRETEEFVAELMRTTTLYDKR